MERISYGLSQTEIAELVGISRQYYALLESGEKMPTDARKEQIELTLNKRNPKYRLNAVFDYLRVRFPTHDYRAIIRDALQMEFSYFVKEDRGFYGYSQKYVFADIVVMTSPEDDARGTLLELKGQGCRRFEYILEAQRRTWNDFFIACISKEGVFKRFDLAINDTGGILSIPALSRKLGTPECNTIFQRYQVVRSGETLKQEAIDEKSGMGNTIYLGSMRSDIYFCIYEKDYEQYAKLGIPIEDAAVKNRFELRLKNDRAYCAIMDLINFEDVENTAFEIINRYVRFLQADECEPISAWALDFRWAWFIGNGREKLRLTMQPEPYNLEKTYKWLSDQVAPSLTLIKIIDELYGYDFVERIEKARLPEKQRKLLDQYTADIADIVTILPETAADDFCAPKRRCLDDDALRTRMALAAAETKLREQEEKIEALQLQVALKQLKMEGV